MIPFFQFGYRGVIFGGNMGKGFSFFNLVIKKRRWRGSYRLYHCSRRGNNRICSDFGNERISRIGDNWYATHILAINDAAGTDKSSTGGAFDVMVNSNAGSISRGVNKRKIVKRIH